MFPVYISIPHHRVYYKLSRAVLSLEKLISRLQSEYRSKYGVSQDSPFVNIDLASQKLLQDPSSSSLISSFKKPLFIYKNPQLLDNAASSSLLSLPSSLANKNRIARESTQDKAPLKDSNKINLLLDETISEDSFSNSFSQKLYINSALDNNYENTEEDSSQDSFLSDSKTNN